MIVVVIIGLLATLALPFMESARRRAHATRFANDFQKFESVFQQYNIEHGGWPPAAGPGVIPTGMSGDLPPTYVAPSPMGGNYSWSGSTGRIRLTGTTADDAVMQRVDALIDDGNLRTGDFESMLSGGYHLQLH